MIQYLSYKKILDLDMTLTSANTYAIQVTAKRDKLDEMSENMGQALIHGEQDLTSFLQVIIAIICFVVRHIAQHSA